MSTFAPAKAVGRGPGLGGVALRALGYLAAEMLTYVIVVALMLHGVSILIALVPFPGITTTPETRVINRVGLSLQSLKHLLFEDELSTLYAPSPPPLG